MRTSAKDMNLRKGDFIEDRFGQAQRNLLSAERQDPERLQKIFRWFGSYLALVGSGDEIDREQSTLVGHCRGRTRIFNAEVKGTSTQALHKTQVTV